MLAAELILGMHTSLYNEQEVYCMVYNNYEGNTLFMLAERDAWLLNSVLRPTI